MTKVYIVGDTKLPLIAAAPLPTIPRFILVDWQGEQQTQIVGGRFVLPAGSDDALIFNAANDILGGSTTARLGKRLRVEKGWTYGIYSGSNGGMTQQYWGFSTLVQTDKAAQSVEEIVNVVKEVAGPLPATQSELSGFVKGQSRSLPGMFENADALLGTLVQSDAYGKPYTWIEGAKTRLNALRLDDVNRLAREYFTPQVFTWVLIGDISKFEQKLRDLNLGTVEVWDRQGRVLR